MKIDIDIDDIYAFYDIASLVDQDSFLEEIVDLRKKYKLTIGKDIESLRVSSKYSKETAEINNKINGLTNNPDNLSIEQLKKIYSKLNKERVKFAKLSSPAENYRISIMQLVERYSKPSYFELVVQAAVEKGRVTNEDYIRGMVMPKYLYDVISPVEIARQSEKATEMIITIYPNTTPKELDTLYTKAKKYMQNEAVVIPKKIKNKLKLHRNIYWFWKENRIQERKKDWDDIVEEWKDQCAVHKQGGDHPENEGCMYCNFEPGKPDEKTFRDAIAAYQKWLQEVL